MRSLKYALAFICAFAFLSTAEARPHPSYEDQTWPDTVQLFSVPLPAAETQKWHRRGKQTKSRHINEGGSYWAKPSRWCGWWMRTQFGGGPEFNLARNWARRGSSAGGPAVGAVVVWPHHVGIITGQAANGRWIVKSGNDSHRVRERVRSVGGAIAFRFV